MTGLKQILDLLAACTGAVRAEMTLPASWPTGATLSLVAVAAGLALALWGARLLRTLYVLAFIGLGAAIGVKVAQRAGVDLLIGLVLGAGIAGLAGYVLFRWWVAVTAACCAALLIASVALARNLPDIPPEARRAEAERWVRVAASVRPPDQSKLTAWEAAAAGRAYLAELFGGVWGTHRDVVYRASAVVVLAWLTGLGMGLTLPRFTSILGTSCVGVLLLLLGAGALISRYWPGVREMIESQELWCAVGAGVMLLLSLVIQARHRRPAAAPQPAAAPAS